MAAFCNPNGNQDAFALDAVPRETSHTWGSAIHATYLRMMHEGMQEEMLRLMKAVRQANGRPVAPVRASQRDQQVSRSSPSASLPITRTQAILIGLLGTPMTQQGTHVPAIVPTTTLSEDPTIRMPPMFTVNHPSQQIRPY